MATTITTPKLWIPGDPLNQTNLNKELRDQMNGLLASPYCAVTIAVAPTIVNNTGTVVAWTAEIEDPDNMHDTVTNNSRVVAPIAGVYHVLASFRWVWAAGGFRYSRLFVNGAASGGEVTESPGGGGGTTVQIERDLRLKANDYVELSVQQTSGGNLNGEFNPSQVACSMHVLWEQN